MLEKHVTHAVGSEVDPVCTCQINTATCGWGKIKLMEHCKPTMSKNVNRIQSEKTNHSNPERFSLGQNWCKVSLYF